MNPITITPDMTLRSIKILVRVDPAVERIRGPEGDLHPFRGTPLAHCNAETKANVIIKVGVPSLNMLH